MTENSYQLSRNVISLLAISIALFTAGCNKTIARENILSSIETGIGLTLAENKQTQMYELKAGYIRSQFYSIPTGKVVENEHPTIFISMSSCRKAALKLGNGTKGEQSLAFEVLSSCKKVALNSKSDQLSNAANITPELVSGIRAHTGLQDILLGMKVSESFAVGKEAVRSNAAVAMYIAMAEDSATAQAASDAINSLTYDDDPSVKCLNGWLKEEKNVKTLKDWWTQKSQKGIGVIRIKSKENKEIREKFMEDHPEVKCD